MLLAIKDNQRILAEPEIKDAHCEICGDVLIPKCGKIKIWHWAHKNSMDCDNWSEEETEWHKEWKNKFPIECQEVKIGKHRADVKLISGIVIEFQHSLLSSEQIIEREKFYNNMIWVLDGESICAGLELRKKENIFTFRWRTPPKSWWFAKCPIFIHLNGKMARKIYKNYWETKKEYLHQFDGSFLFELKKIHTNIPCGGWGKIITKEDFLKWILN